MVKPRAVSALSPRWKELIKSMVRPKTQVTTDDGDGVGEQLSWWVVLPQEDALALRVPYARDASNRRDATEVNGDSRLVNN
jgi:hypothetical protein